MKKIYHIIIASACTLMAMSGLTSCGDNFLHEQNDTAYTTQYFKTEQGIIDLATSLYGNIRWHFAYEWAYATTLYGTDEFGTANDLTSEPWNTYDTRFGSVNPTVETGAANKNCPGVSFLWDEMYFGISSANLIIASADKITNEDVRKKALGEAYFMRGYNYYRLFAQYGGIVLVTEPLNGPVRSFQRSSAEETMALIIDDFTKAHENLPTSKWRGYGTWTKYTAAHFLAKALLFRASERNDEWNSSYKTADLTQCITLCDEVIQACPLASDYNKLYAEWDKVDCSNEGLDEILMSAQFNADSSVKGRYGNRTINYQNPQFSNFSGGWVARNAWIGGKDFQRIRPTEYNYSVYDNVNDSRLWKSFRTIYGINTLGKYPSELTTGQKPALGDYGIVFILNKKTDSRYNDVRFGCAKAGAGSNFINPETGKWVPNAAALYQSGQFTLWKASGIDENRSNMWPGLNKVADGTTDNNADAGYRDVIMARSGETYLIKAEALVRQEKYQDAVNVVNQLRNRAQYKSGENREYYTDGVMAYKTNTLYQTASNKTAYENTFKQKNTYYLSTGIARTTDASDLKIVSYTKLPTEDEVILSALNCSGDKDRMLNFIMNERTRELNGEWNRWDELSRTNLLIRRTKAFNSQAAPNIQEKHTLRPIPQTFIDQLVNKDGSNLTDTQKKALQNPGY